LNGAYLKGIRKANEDDDLGFLGLGIIDELRHSYKNYTQDLANDDMKLTVIYDQHSRFPKLTALYTV
jgi:hypothetical protein